VLPVLQVKYLLFSKNELVKYSQLMNDTISHCNNKNVFGQLFFTDPHRVDPRITNDLHIRFVNDLCAVVYEVTTFEQTSNPTTHRREVEQTVRQTV